MKIEAQSEISISPAGMSGMFMSSTLTAAVKQ